MNNFTTKKITVPIDQIVPNRWNPNVQSKEMFQKGVNSVTELGMLGSILVRETGGCYEILDGEHRWKYLKELKYTECPVETMGEIDDTQAQLLTVLLNNLRGKDDIEKRAKIYEALNEGQLSLLPFSEQEIQNEKDLFKWDFSQYDKKEDVEAKPVTRSFIIPLTEDEYVVVQKTMAIVKNEDKQTPKQVFMEWIKNYLDLHLGSNGSSTVEFPEEKLVDTTIQLL